jgi:hypothetical protein
MARIVDGARHRLAGRNLPAVDGVTTLRRHTAKETLMPRARTVLDSVGKALKTLGVVGVLAGTGTFLAASCTDTSNSGNFDAGGTGAAGTTGSGGTGAGGSAGAAGGSAGGSGGATGTGGTTGNGGTTGGAGTTGSGGASGANGGAGTTGAGGSNADAAANG